MAAIDEMDIPPEITPHLLKTIKGTESKVRIASPDKVRQLISTFFWIWFEDNRDKVAIRISLFRGFVKTSIYVYQLEDLFISLFGPKDGVSS